MNIQYLSDLHMEFADDSRYLKNVEFPVTGDILVLAGDTFYLNNTTTALTYGSTAIPTPTSTPL